jgi:predicted transglutaminase-like cysteine proteinase
MVRRSALVISILAVSSLAATAADARDRSVRESIAPAAVAEGAPTLAPFQHVRFCLRYPSECKSDPAGEERISMSPETRQLLDGVNGAVNAEIAPTVKSYGSNLQSRWNIAPDIGDCNDYAVTKRHELTQAGLPAKALRLAVVKTPSGVGHLILVVATTKGDIVLDNLTGAILPWQQTGYQWLKIQSASDARLWYSVTAPRLAHADQAIRLAQR